MNLWAYEAFILDLDGTLIDSGKFHARAFADSVLAENGYALKPAEHHEFFASHTNIFTGVLNERYGMDLDWKRVLQRKRKRMKEIFKAELFPGAQEFLDFWRGRKPMALATNSPLAFVKPALEEAGLLDYFDAVTTADEVERRKPAPEIIEISLQKLNVDATRVLVFEDQLIGVDAALTAGTRVLAVNNGQPVQFPDSIAVHTWNELLNLSVSHDES